MISHFKCHHKRKSGSNWRSPLVDPVQNGGLSKLDNWLTLENWFKKYPQFLDEVTFSDTSEKNHFMIDTSPEGTLSIFTFTKVIKSVPIF